MGVITRIQTEVFPRQNLGNLLRALDRANASIGDNLAIPGVILFRSGFRAAIEAMARRIRNLLRSSALEDQGLRGLARVAIDKGLPLC